MARNFRQGMRQSVAFLSVHSRSAALPSRVSLIDKFYCVCLFPFAKFFFFFHLCCATTYVGEIKLSIKILAHPLGFTRRSITL